MIMIHKVCTNYKNTVSLYCKVTKTKLQNQNMNKWKIDVLPRLTLNVSCRPSYVIIFHDIYQLTTIKRTYILKPRIIKRDENTQHEQNIFYLLNEIFPC